MAITKNTPVTVPAVAEKTYNVWWVENLCLDASNPSEGIVMVIDYRLCYLLPTGLPEFHPTERKRVLINNLFAYMSDKPELASTVWTAVDTLGNIGKTEGVLD